MDSEALQQTGDPAAGDLELSTEILVAQSADGVLASHQSQEERLILRREEVEALVAAPGLCRRLRDLAQLFRGNAGIVQCREEVEVAAICGGEEAAEGGKAVDGLADGSDLARGSGAVAMFYLGPLRLNSCAFLAENLAQRRKDAKTQAGLGMAS